MNTVDSVHNVLRLCDRMERGCLREPFAFFRRASCVVPHLLDTLSNQHLNPSRHGELEFLSRYRRNSCRGLTNDLSVWALLQYGAHGFPQRGCSPFRESAESFLLLHFARSWQSPWYRSTFADVWHSTTGHPCWSERRDNSDLICVDLFHERRRTKVSLLVLTCVCLSDCSLKEYVVFVLDFASGVAHLQTLTIILIVVLECTICASWARSFGWPLLAIYSFFCHLRFSLKQMRLLSFTWPFSFKTLRVLCPDLSWLFEILETTSALFGEPDRHDLAPKFSAW